jgi:hypothetical protein
MKKFKIKTATQEFLIVGESLDDCPYYFGLPERPELDAEGNPTGQMLPAEYTVEIIDISAEVALQNCIAARKSEYPSAEEFLNAFFDGGEQALAELQAKRLAVKAKYPKPSEGEE